MNCGLNYCKNPLHLYFCFVFKTPISQHYLSWLHACKLFCLQGIVGLDCWITHSGSQSNLVDWIVINNPKLKSDFGFDLSILFLHFNPNPKAIIFLIRKQKAKVQANTYLKHLKENGRSLANLMIKNWTSEDTKNFKHTVLTSYKRKNNRAASNFSSMIPQWE